MEHRWIIGPNHHVRILNEFSVTELIGIIHAIRGDTQRQVALTANEVRELKELNFNGHRWEVLYSRQESDDRGSYIASALRLVEDPRPSNRFEELLDSKVKELWKQVFGPKP